MIDRKNFNAAARVLSKAVELQALFALDRAGWQGYRATPDAPDLNASVPVSVLIEGAVHAMSTDRLFPVFDGGVDDIVYSSARVNYLFRAWHDIVHIEMGLGFDADSEIRVAREQAQ